MIRLFTRALAVAGVVFLWIGIFHEDKVAWTIAGGVIELIALILLLFEKRIEINELFKELKHKEDHPQIVRKISRYRLWGLDFERLKVELSENLDWRHSNDEAGKMYWLDILWLILKCFPDKSVNDRAVRACLLSDSNMAHMFGKGADARFNALTTTQVKKVVAALVRLKEQGDLQLTANESQRFKGYIAESPNYEADSELKSLQSRL